MKNIIKLFLFVVLVCLFGKIEASHIMGSDMTYKRISSKKYEITLTIYRDCRGIPMATTANIKVEAPGFGTQNVTFTEDTIMDVSAVCKSATAPCTPANTTTGKGVEAHVYKGIIDLNSTPFSTWITSGACKFYFSWTECCRNGAINTGVSGPFYTYCMLDICVGENNSSPIFSAFPVGQVCCNQPVRLSLGGQDYADFDSLSYKLVPALGSSRTDVLNPTSPLTATEPLTSYCLFGMSIPCTPIPTADPPIGVYFNEKTGYFVFTPTKCDEIGVLAFEISEWRKVGGVYKLIGLTRRDIQLEVFSCTSNNPPTIKSSIGNNISINKSQCDVLTFQISTEDKRVLNPPPLPHQTPDTTHLSVANMPPGATFKIIDYNVRERVGQFTWKIPANIPKDFRTQVVFTVNDSFCPTPSTGQLIVSINLDSAKNNSKLEGFVKYDSNSNCAVDTFDTGVNREVQVVVNGRAQKVVTNQAGYYGFCVETDTGYVKLLEHPFYNDQCRADSNLRFKASLPHTINFATRLKSGLYGQVIYDKNTNCVQDVGEIAYYKPIYIVAQPGNIISSTDNFGNYYLPLDSHVNYTIYVRDSLKYFGACSKSFKFNYAKDSAYFTNKLLLGEEDFDNVFLAHTNNGNTLRLATTGKSTFRLCNRDTTKYGKTYATLLIDSNLSSISVTANSGTATMINKGEYKISFDSFNTTSYYDSILGWQRPELAPKDFYKNQYVTVNYWPNLPKYNFDSSFLIAFRIDSLTIKQSAERINDSISRRIYVRAAYDPNVKTTVQNKYITPVNTQIDYQIQFQNTGNDTAYNIELRDTLPPYLNYATFRLKNSSHPVRPLLNGNILFFYFDNIFLPDSGKNFAASIGSIDFSFMAYDTMKENKNLFNNASIYFDVQEPVKTNTSHIVYHSPTVVNALDKQLYCYQEKIKVPFTGVYDASKHSNHKYYLQISTVTDNFANPVLLDSIQSDLTFDTFKIVLPKSIVSGKYKFRVVGSPAKAIPFEPFYSAAFEYKAKDWASIYTKKTTAFCEGQTIKFIADTGYSNYSFVKNFTVTKNNLKDSVYPMVLAPNDISIYAILTYKNTCDIITDTLPISVKLIDTARFTIKDSFLCTVPHSFNLTNESRGLLGTKYYLSANGNLVDSSTSLGQKLNFNPSQSGRFKLTLLAKTQDGCEASDTHNVIAGIKPTASFTVVNSPICGNQPIQINNTATGNGNGIDSAIYIWGDGARDAKTNHKYSTLGMFNLNQIVKDSFGCADTANTTALLNPAPIAIFNYTLDSCFQNNKIIVNMNSTFNGSAKQSETIYFGDNNSSSSTSANNNYTGIGNYQVSVIALNQDNCADTATADISIHPNPTFSLNTVSIDSCLHNNNIEIEALGADLQKVSWDMGDGSNLIGTKVGKTYSLEGVYAITATASNSFECVATQNVNVNILPDMDVALTVNDVCEQESIVFQINTIYNKVNDFGYSLNYNGNTIAGNYPSEKTQTATNAQPGLYQSQLIALATNGCSDTVLVKHSVFNKPNASFSLDILSNKVNFINMNTQTENLWFYGNKDSAINNNVNHSYTYSANGDYTVILKVTDNNNCFDTAEQNIHILGGISFFVPSAFTPNNDGKNDQLTISGTEYIAKLNFKLYNRWGQQVYESNDHNDLLTKTDLSDGSYLYVMYIQDIKGFKHYINGTLMILK